MEDNEVRNRPPQLLGLLESDVFVGVEGGPMP